MRARAAVIFTLTIGLASGASSAGTYGGCQVFPADNYWNSRIDSANVHPSSATWINSIGSSTRLHADFGADFGFTPRTVTASQPLVPITISDPARSDPGPMPIPPSLASTSATEISVTETTNCILYEFYGSTSNGGASWNTGTAARWTLSSNALRPEGWQSGDHAGLPFLVGLLRWDEVASGEIDHAIRFTSSSVSNTYLWPARYGQDTAPADPSRPPFGARFRLKASFDISGYDPRTQVVLRALKKYGLVLSSQGGSWFLQGASDPGWADVVISQLQGITGNNFEAVDTAPLMINVNSGQAVQLPAPSGGGGGVTSGAIAQVYDAGVVLASVVQPDGKVIIGGEFGYVNGVARNNIARLNADGSLDASWNPGASSYVAALAVDSSGNVYAGGNFQQIGGQSRDFVAKLSGATGAADATWNPGANNPVFALVPDGAGSLYVGGDFNSVGGQPRNRVARVSTSGAGAVDAWNPGADAIVFSIALDGAGSVFVGGRFANIGGVARNYLAKVSASSGATDASWNASIDTAGNNGIHAMVIAAGNVYAGGEFFSVGGQSRGYLARFPAAGSGAVDTGWNPNAASTLHALAFDGTNLYAGGGFNSIGGQGRNGVARMPLTGAAADGWNPNATAPVRSLALGGGNVYVGGHFVSLGGATRGGFAAISASSASAVSGWPSVFSPGQVYSVARDGAGRTIIAGRFVAMGDATTLRSNIARFNADGSLDSAWNPDPNGHVAAVLPDASGNVYAAGYFSFIGGQTRGYLARLTAATGAADAWNPGADYIVWTLASDAAGDVYAGGYFGSVGGQPRNRLAKISAAGVVDPSWNPNANNTVLALATDGAGSVFAGGEFTSIGGTARGGLAKISSASGAVDATWNPDANADVRALAIDGSGSVFAGGGFRIIGGQGRNYIAKLSTGGSGAADATWNPDADFTVSALKLDGSGLYVGGDFGRIGGATRNNLAKISATGTGAADASFDPAADSTVRAFAVDASGNVHVGGSFTRIAGTSRIGYAVLAAGTTGGGSGGGGSGSGGGTGGGGGGTGGGGSGADPFPAGGAMPSGWIQPAGSNAAWTVATDAAHEGGSSLKSGAIGAGQKSELAVTRVFNAGNVAFARKVSGGTLEFYIDGALQGSWSGTQDWVAVTHAVPAGTHTLLWRQSDGGNAWIDSVTLPGVQTCLERRCTPR